MLKRLNRNSHFSIAYHEMLRTKCLNIYCKPFQIGLYRNYHGSINGQFLGLTVALFFPFMPWRKRFFIPSLFVLIDCLKYLIYLSSYSPIKKLKFTLCRYDYWKKA